MDETNVHIVWAREDEQNRRRFRHIKAERRAAKLTEHDRPEKPGWRLGRAVSDIIEAGYPADVPTEHVAQSSKIVGLASLLVWPDPLPMLGELGRWEWESKPDTTWEANSADPMDDLPVVAAKKPKPAKRSPRAVGVGVEHRGRYGHGWTGPPPPAGRG